MGVTSGRQWRQAREEGVVITLPSGNKARLRPVDVSMLLMQGKIPDMLTPVALATIMEGLDADELAKPEALQKYSNQLLEYFNLICKASFLEPRIVDNPQADDEISIEDVSPEDRGIVFGLATRGAEALRLFRERQIANVEPVPDGNSDGPEAKSTGEPDGGHLDSVPA